MVTGTFFEKGPLMDEIEAIMEICKLQNISKDYKCFCIERILKWRLKERDPKKILDDATEHDRKLSNDKK